MLEILGQLLAPSVAVAVSPFPLIAVVPVLSSSTGGRIRGVVFLLGWLVGLVAMAALAAVLISVMQEAADGESSSLLPAWIELLAGLMLVAFGIRKWCKFVDQDGHAERPGWMDRMSSIGAMSTAGVGFLLAAANPKIIVFAIGAMSAVAMLDPSATENAFAVVAFALIGSTGTAVPVGIACGMQDRSEQLLATLGDWLAQHERAIMGTLLLVIGVGLVGDALTAIG
jgi:threonine/homoserine/homoserine lactone efflux protein